MNAQTVEVRLIERYWLWLQCALGVSATVRSQELCEFYQSNPQSIYDSSEYERRISGMFTAAQIGRLSAATLSDAEVLLEKCRKFGISIETPDLESYPTHLREITGFPLVLYRRGKPLDLERRVAIAVVGTRKADRKSVEIASRLSTELVRGGCVVVSGGALGVDSAAHWGAIHADGKTIAVLGNPFDSSYLAENASMRERICETGTLITEFPLGAPIRGSNFPIRNRIISGLSLGVVVVEAGERSGSLITANLALEQGRDVFAVPGDVYGSTYTGGNKLIREGAKPVFSAFDILVEYERWYPDLLDMKQVARDLERASISPDQVAVKKSPKSAPKSAKTPDQNPDQKTVPEDSDEGKLVQLLQNKIMHVDELGQASGLSFGALCLALLNLEVAGIIQQMPGKRYELALK